MSYRVVLVKLLSEKFLEDFLNGNLYLNTLDYFSNLDHTDRARADRNDGAQEAIQVQDLAVQDDDGNWISISGIINPVIFRSDALIDLNLLCFYTITDRPGDKFDDQNIELGNMAVFISDLPEFVRRVRNAAALNNWDIAHGPIEYVEPTIYDGPIGPFRKFQSYAHQREFRFVFKTGTRGPCRLNVGDLRDITYITSSSKVTDIWAQMRGENVQQSE